MGFRHVAQAGLELLDSRDPHASASRSAGIIDSSVRMRNGLGHVQWFTPIIPTHWEAKAGRLFELSSLTPMALPVHTREEEMIGAPSRIKNHGRVRELTPVIPALWEAQAGRSQGQETETILAKTHFGRLRWMDCLRSGVQGQPGQHDETPSLLKMQKISWWWWQAPVITAAREAEAGESFESRRDRVSLCPPGWSTMARSLLTATSTFWAQGDPPTSASQVAGTASLHTHAQLIFFGRDALWEAEVGGSRGQEIKTILANMLLARLWQENLFNSGIRGCSELRLGHCTPAWGQSKTPSPKKKKNLQKNKTTTITKKWLRWGQPWWFTPVIPALWETKAGRSRDGQRGEPAGQHGETLTQPKNTKISWAWWRMPVILATREAKAGELLEPTRQTLQ
ncbi:MAP kinase-interacting serine/threonine-protein kinase 1 [Plecturocebus cupreus]